MVSEVSVSICMSWMATSSDPVLHIYLIPISQVSVRALPRELILCRPAPLTLQSHPPYSKQGTCEPSTESSQASRKVVLKGKQGSRDWKFTLV